MKTYPIYKVIANYKIILGNDLGQTFTINVGDIGTFQARTDNTTVVTQSKPEPIVIDVVFNGHKFTTRPKGYIPNGDIKTYMLLPIKTNTGIPEFTILDTIYPAIKNKSYSNIDGENKEPIAVKTLNKTSSSRYIKQRDFILTLTALGTLSGFSRAKLLQKSTTAIILTTTIYAAVSALAAWGLASAINEKY